MLAVDELTVSVIAIGFNEERTIEKLMVALKNQTRPPDEIIFVDGHSTDGTWEIAKQYANMLLRDKRKGAAAARNLGAANALSDIILFIDSDSYPAPNWVEVMERNFKKGFVAVGGFVRPADGNAAARTVFHVVNIWNMLKEAFSYGGLHGSNCGFRKEDFLAIGGFLENYTMMEDVEISGRITKRGKTKVDPDSIVWSSTRRLQQQRFFDIVQIYARAYHDDYVKNDVKLSYFGEIKH